MLLKRVFVQQSAADLRDVREPQPAGEEPANGLLVGRIEYRAGPAIRYG